MDRRMRLAGALACLAVVAGCQSGTFATPTPGSAGTQGATASQAEPTASSAVGEETPVPSATKTPGRTDVPTASATAQRTATPTPAPSATGVDRWVAAGKLSMGRSATHAVTLSDGRVLVVGNDNTCVPGGPDDTSVVTEIYDPASNAWSKTGSLNAPRDVPFAAALSGGRALVTGGMNENQIAYSSTKVWNPGSGTWANSGLLSTARTGAAGVTLMDGRVLVAGGIYADDSGTDSGYRTLATAEIFDPATGKWTKTGSLAAPRESAKAVLVSEGRVLVAGGFDGSGNALATSEVWDPQTGKWSDAGKMATLRVDFALVTLSDWSALAIGGFAGENGPPLASVERWEESVGRWVPAPAMRTAAGHRAAAVLGDGRVLVAGGETSHWKGVIAATEVFVQDLDDPVGHWVAAPTLPEKRTRAVAVELKDGSVLVLGGDQGLEGEPSTPWCPRVVPAAVLRFVPAFD